MARREGRQQTQRQQPVVDERQQQSQGRMQQRKQEVDEEVWLHRRARDYSELQRRKAVKWFVSHGTPLLTEDERAAIAEGRVAELARRAALQRAEDRARVAVQRGGVVAVPITMHPQHRADADGADEVSAPHFAAGAASGLRGRQVLREAVAALVWAKLLSNRVEARLGRAAKQLQRSSGATVGLGGTRRSGPLPTAPPLAILQLPEFLPAPDSGAWHTSDEEAPRGSAATRVFAPLPLKVPFEFQLKGYKQLPLPEHHFASADAEQTMASSPAGPSEVPEVAGNVPSLQHFAQPPVTLETFPMRPFALVRTDPREGAVLGTMPQPDSDGGFVAPHHRVDFGHRVPSENAPFDHFAQRTLLAPLPSLLRGPQREDDLSDTDSDEDLPNTHPAGLDAVAAALPPFLRRHGTSTATASTTRPATATTATLAAGTCPPDDSARPSSSGGGSGGGELLAFTFNAVHRIGDEVINAPAKQRLAAMRARLEAVAAALPPQLRMQY